MCNSEKIVLLLRRDFFKTGTTVNDSLKSGGKLKTFENDVIKQGEATIATVQIKIREKYQIQIIYCNNNITITLFF